MKDQKITNLYEGAAKHMGHNLNVERSLTHLGHNQRQGKSCLAIDLQVSRDNKIFEISEMQNLRGENQIIRDQMEEFRQKRLAKNRRFISK
jgi:hypothetical protein